MKRTSYQQGTVTRKPRKLGPDIWVFRYMDSGVQKSDILGTLDKFKTKAAAHKEADKQLAKINERIAEIRISGLCDRYAKEAMPARMLTSAPYRSYLYRIKRDCRHIRVDPMAKDVMGVETWIDGLHTIPP